MTHDNERQQFQCDGPHAQRRLKQDQGQQRGSERPQPLPAIFSFPTQKIDRDNQQHQGAGQIAVHHLFPGLVRLDGAFRKILGRLSDFVRVRRPGQLPIAAGPVWAAEARVGKANDRRPGR